MNMYSQKFIAVLCFLLTVWLIKISYCDDIVPIAPDKFNYPPSKEVIDTQQQVVCFIHLADERLHYKMMEEVRKGVNLFYIDLVFESSDNISRRGLFKPLQWMRVEDYRGMEILRYDERPEVLSRTMLKHKFTSFNVTISEKPSKCLSSLSNEEYELKIRDFLLLGMEDKVSTSNYQNVKEGVNICRMKLDEKILYFFFNCCHISLPDNTFCNQEFVSHRSLPIQVVLYLIIGFCPLFLSARIRMGRKTFEIDCEAFKTHIVFGTNNKESVPLIPREHLVCFDDTPITLKTLVYDHLLRCKFKDPIVRENCPKSLRKGCEYFASILTKTWPIFLLFIVMTVRFTIYMAIEYPEEIIRNNFVAKKTFIYRYPKFLFLYAYVWFSLVAMFLTFCGCRWLVKKLQTLFYASMFDIGEIPFHRIFSWTFYILFLSFKCDNKKIYITYPFYFVISLILCPVILFICTVPLNRMIVFYILNSIPFYLNIRPLAKCSNLLGSWLQRMRFDVIYGNFNHINLQEYKTLEQMTLKSRICFMSIVFLSCTIFYLPPFIFLAFECLHFLIRFTIYNMIGAIQDWERYLAFLVFGFWIFIYSQRAWNSFSGVYGTYNREIHYLLVNLLTERINLSSTRNLEGRLLISSLPDSTGNVQSTMIHNSKIELRQMTIFLDQKNKSYILRHTFEDFRNSDAFGDALVSSKAFSHLAFFTIMTLFILLVFLITQHILIGSNQIVILVVTGVIPWLYERKKSKIAVRIFDTFDVIKTKYKNELDELIRRKHTIVLVHNKNQSQIDVDEDEEENALSDEYSADMYQKIP